MSMGAAESELNSRFDVPLVSEQRSTNSSDSVQFAREGRRSLSQPEHHRLCSSLMVKRASFPLHKSRKNDIEFI